MDAKRKQADGDEYREMSRQTSGETNRDERSDPPEFEIPEEVESWALDDLSDLVPTTFD